MTQHFFRFGVVIGLLVFSEGAFGFVSTSNQQQHQHHLGTLASISKTRKSSSIYQSCDDNCDDGSKKPVMKAVILDPFPQAADPKYAVTAPVGNNGFVVSREGGPTKEELSDENLYKIIDRTASDLEVNTLVWKCLGYRFDATQQEWTTAEVFPKWKERFPTPPDMIGMQRIYSKEIDGPSLRNNQALVKSIPVDNKKSYLKEYMEPFGFKGYKARICNVASRNYVKKPKAMSCFSLFFGVSFITSNRWPS